MFFIVWQGWGFLAVAIPVVCTLLFPKLPFGMGLGLLVGAALSAYIGHRLNNQAGNSYIDKDTGNEVVFRKKHTLFWVPMQYISVVWVVMAIYLMVVSPH
ncbi:hypothetical protein [Pseudomonas baltica]|uniref:hypothetical protein n=1 Tax=Pseudomonas baltica TaxID=2762576 RepID=UPI00289D3792|nr:hypothetical protein [Pseudomonas baltica]